MVNNVQSSPEPPVTRPAVAEPSLTRLMTGIIGDIQDLLQQQMALFRQEISQDFTRSKEAALWLGAGVGLALIGSGFLFTMLVYLLAATTDLPLWGAYGLVGGGLTTMGVAAFLAGKWKFESFNPLPDESATALKENLQCLMNPK